MTGWMFRICGRTSLENRMIQIIRQLSLSKMFRWGQTKPLEGTRCRDTHSVCIKFAWDDINPRRRRESSWLKCFLLYKWSTIHVNKTCHRLSPARRTVKIIFSDGSIWAVSICDSCSSWLFDKILPWRRQEMLRTHFSDFIWSLETKTQVFRKILQVKLG